ncbi:MAG: hypothetical protein NW206_02125 [Hyphomonadaceae bacterium]|nr:hypothetical protein [Hyphomonadaceae bacterium]
MKDDDSDWIRFYYSNAVEDIERTKARQWLVTYYSAGLIGAHFVLTGLFQEAEIINSLTLTLIALSGILVFVFVLRFQSDLRKALQKFRARTAAIQIEHFPDLLKQIHYGEFPSEPVAPRGEAIAREPDKAKRDMPLHTVMLLVPWGGTFFLLLYLVIGFWATVWKPVLSQTGLLLE